MTRRWRVAAGVAGLALLGGVAWWWLRGAESGDHRAGGASVGRAARLTGQAPRGALRWLGQVGLEPGRVAGRVTYGSAPVPNAIVRLELAGVLRPVLAVQEVRTGADGAFDFGPQPPTEMLVYANAPDRAPAGALVDLRDPTQAPPPDRLELALGDCTHTVYGTVHDHGGGIAAATVRVATRRGAIATTTTGDDGSYALCFGPGGGAMVVEAEGYARAQLEVETGKRMRRDVELFPEALLTGMVVGPDGQPAAGALVHVRASEMNPMAREVSSAVTGDEGRFSLGGLSAGRYLIAARDAGRRTAAEEEVVAAVGGGEEVTLRLVDMATVRGRVVEDGRPVSGARLAQRTGRFIGVGRSFVDTAHAVSQPDGTFVLDAVPPGTFSIAVDEYEVLEPLTAEAVTPTTEIVVKVAHKARVLGRVTREGRPVADVSVRLIGSDRSWGGSATTTADGMYEVGGLDPGTFEIMTQSEAAFARTQSITVAKGQRLEGVDIELDLAGEVSGVVVDQHGAPVAGVAVIFEMGPQVDWGFATTEEDGTFVAGAMSGGGTYEVMVKPSRSSPVELGPAPGTPFPEISLSDGKSRATGIRIAVQLDRKSISGVVVGADGKPVADVNVTAYPPLKSDMMMQFTQPAASSVSGADGAFALHDLLSGDYTVRAMAGTGVKVTAEKVPAGRSDLRLSLPATGAVDGELVGFTDKTRVSASPMTSFEHFTGRVRGPHFTIEAIPPGSYMVSARDGARTDHSYVEVAPGKRATVKLTSKGTASVSGRAINLVTREPLGGLECSESAGWQERSQSATTDTRGAFKLEVPAGRSTRIHCMGPTARFRAMGGASVELEPDTTKEVLVEVVVTRRAASRPGDVGMRLQPGPPVVVYKVDPGGSAERAGVKVGDSIQKVDGVDVSRFESRPVWMLMLDHAIGDKVELVLGRDRREVRASVEIVDE
jgi:hypothetical protein